ACTGAAALGIACDDTDTATKIFGGYQFNKNLAVEVGYADLGKATASIPGVSAEWKTTTWDILAVGILPINQQFSVLGKIGMASWSLDASLTALGVGSATQSASGTDVTYAVGVQYDFNDKVGLRAEWQTYSNIGDENTTGQSDVDVIGASVLFRF
ncbi:MAG: outer membrane beta-barrel protein, partial [Burkholderiales bacterium]